MCLYISHARVACFVLYFSAECSQWKESSAAGVTPDELHTHLPLEHRLVPPKRKLQRVLVRAGATLTGSKRRPRRQSGERPGHEGERAEVIRVDEGTQDARSVPQHVHSSMVKMHSIL